MLQQTSLAALACNQVARFHRCSPPGCCRSVALTVPAYVAADLIISSCSEAAEGLRSLDYPPVAAVSVAYPMSSLRQDRLDAAGALPGRQQPGWGSAVDALTDAAHISCI